MKAAVIYEHGGPDSIRYEAGFPDPKPAAGEVLVRVKATALNYHDIFTRRGMPGIRVPMPCIMGIDFAGEIAELGAGVSDWVVGDRVMIDPVDRVGGGGLIGEVRPGGLAEYCAVPTHNVVRLPASVPYEAAACLPVAYGTALRMMVTIGQVKAGEKVLILGASGGVGTCCVQLAKLAGAEVIVCASSAEKLARLKDLGADHGIDYSKEDFVKWVYAKYGKPHRRRFDGGVDVVVNFTGGDTWVPSLKALHRQGRVLTCGATAGFDPKEDLRYIWTFELNIRGGQHPGRGTHNALLSLGGRQYLEIIAMDPMQAEAPGLLFPELKGLSQPRLIAWAVAVKSVVDTANRAKEQNIETIGPLAGSRAQADGGLLTWKTLRIGGPRVQGLPFFIEWQKGTAHPSQHSPSGCTLASFEVVHTDTEWMRRTLKSLGAEANIVPGSRVRLKARIHTPKGDVELT